MLGIIATGISIARRLWRETEPAAPKTPLDYPGAIQNDGERLMQAERRAVQLGRQLVTGRGASNTRGWGLEVSLDARVWAHVLEHEPQMLAALERLEKGVMFSSDYFFPTHFRVLTLAEAPEELQAAAEKALDQLLLEYDHLILCDLPTGQYEEGHPLKDIAEKLQRMCVNFGAGTPSAPEILNKALSALRDRNPDRVHLLHANEFLERMFGPGANHFPPLTQGDGVHLTHSGQAMTHNTFVLPALEKITGVVANTRMPYGQISREREDEIQRLYRATHDDEWFDASLVTPSELSWASHVWQNGKDANKVAVTRPFTSFFGRMRSMVRWGVWFKPDMSIPVIRRVQQETGKKSSGPEPLELDLTRLLGYRKVTLHPEPLSPSAVSDGETVGVDEANPMKRYVGVGSDYWSMFGGYVNYLFELTVAEETPKGMKAELKLSILPPLAQQEQNGDYKIQPMRFADLDSYLVGKLRNELVENATDYDHLEFRCHLDLTRYGTGGPHPGANEPSNREEFQALWNLRSPAARLV